MNDNLRNYTLTGYEDDWKDAFRQRFNHAKSTSRLVIYEHEIQNKPLNNKNTNIYTNTFRTIKKITIMFCEFFVKFKLCLIRTIKTIFNEKYKRF